MASGLKPSIAPRADLEPKTLGGLLGAVHVYDGACRALHQRRDGQPFRYRDLDSTDKQAVFSAAIMLVRAVDGFYLAKHPRAAQIAVEFDGFASLLVNRSEAERLARYALHAETHRAIEEARTLGLQSVDAFNPCPTPLARRLAPLAQHPRQSPLSAMTHLLRRLTSMSRSSTG